MTEDMLRRFEEAKARESTLLWYEWMRIIVPAVKNVPIADLREMFTPCMTSVSYADSSAISRILTPHRV